MSTLIQLKTKTRAGKSETTGGRSPSLLSERKRLKSKIYVCFMLTTPLNSLCCISNSFPHMLHHPPFLGNAPSSGETKPSHGLSIQRKAPPMNVKQHKLPFDCCMPLPAEPLVKRFLMRSSLEVAVVSSYRRAPSDFKATPLLLPDVLRGLFNTKVGETNSWTPL